MTTRFECDKGWMEVYDIPGDNRCYINFTHPDSIRNFTIVLTDYEANELCKAINYITTTFDYGE